MQRARLLAMVPLFIMAYDGLGAVPRTMSYQGRLAHAAGGLVADGDYRLTFSLYNTEISGAVLWTETHVSVPVVNGTFTVILGTAGSPLTLPFDQQYWLGIKVQGGTELTPRLQLASAPYSLNSLAVVDGAITNVMLADNAVTTAKIQPALVSSVDGVSNDGGNIDILPQNAITVTPSDAANTITVGETHSGRTDNPHNTSALQVAALVSLDGVSNPGGNIDLVSGSNITLTPNDAANTITISAAAPGASSWNLSGNAGTTPGSNFLGTTDNKALELKVNGARVLKLEPNATSPNVIAGSHGNTVPAGVHGATIGGGGTDGYVNQATQNYATVSGGQQNTASGEMATVGGGSGNTAQGGAAVVAGGTNNTATMDYASVGGGYSNQAQAIYASIAGGQENTASGAASYACIGGGRYNNADHEYATVGGGFSNSAGASYATIGGGGRSSPGDPSTGNRVTDDYGTIGGGGNNLAGDATGTLDSATYATIGGGQGNIASGQYATVGGGRNNQAVSKGATISGGGYGNLVTDDFGTISGGMQNKSGDSDGDAQSAAYASVGGGYNNSAIGGFSAIGGGWSNHAFERGASIGGGAYNWAAGKYATIAGGGPVDENFIAGNEVVDDYGTVGGGGWNQAGSEDYDSTNSQYATVPGGRENKAIGAYSFAAGRRAIADGAGSFVWADDHDNDMHAWGENQFVVRATGGFWLITRVAEDGYPLEGMMLPANTSRWVPIGTATAQVSGDDGDRLQELQAENEDLGKRIAELESRVAALERLVGSSAQ